MRALFSSVLAATALLAASCDPPIPENNSCEGAWFEPFLAPETESTGDLSCAEGALTDEAPFAASCQVNAELDGQVVDHQSSDPAPDIDVDVFHSNDVSGAPDWSATSDADGAVAHEVPLCTPIAYVTDRGADGNARVTFGQHVVIPPNEDGGAPTFDFRSVANGTISLITLILAVDLKDENGFVFGKAAGCDGEVAVDKVQILVRDGNCSVPQSFSPGYTTNETPDAFARATTADGFFFGSNVPPGDWILEGYVRDGESFRLVASAPITVRAKEVTLVDLQLGRSDGIRVKEGCRSGC